MAFSINNLLCVGCGDCRRACARNAILEFDCAFSIDSELCIDCGECKNTCCRNAISELNTMI